MVKSNVQIIDEIRESESETADQVNYYMRGITRLYCINCLHIPKDNPSLTSNSLLILKTMNLTHILDLMNALDVNCFIYSTGAILIDSESVNGEITKIKTTGIHWDTNFIELKNQHLKVLELIYNLLTKKGDFHEKTEIKN